MTEFYEKLLTVSEESHIKTQEEMKLHTTMRVGGPAAWYVSPADTKELAAITALCREEAMPYCILGNGSNLLVSDSGYEGVMISMTEGFADCKSDEAEGVITAGAGVPLAKIARTALSASLTGFEFASGIPGTLGGAVMMNAGAYGSEIKDVIVSALVLTSVGQILELSKEELELGYRTSRVMRRQEIVLEASFLLQHGDEAVIKARMEELAGKRREKQPLEYPSCGSTFKRPAGHYAGQLIEEAGLRGFSIGGACVSEKHCGFVINRDHATASDVMRLIEEVKRRVRETSGVSLELEVKTVGKF